METDRHLVGAPALVETARWAPRYVSVLLCVLVAAGGAAILYEYACPHRTEVYWRGLLAGLPFMALLAYGALLFAFNKTEVRAIPGSVEVRDRPLPVGFRPRKFRMQVSRRATTGLLSSPDVPAPSECMPREFNCVPVSGWTFWLHLTAWSKLGRLPNGLPRP